MAQGIVSFRLSVNKDLSGTDREQLGDSVIERILERTANGQDIEGNSFAGYSTDYLNDLERIGAPTNVDLQLTGEMLSSIEILSHGEGYINIGVQPGTEAVNKARWNQGGNSQIPTRNFMGIADSDFNKMEAEVVSNSINVAAQRFLREENIIERLFARRINLGDTDVF